jgi:hypothetical protein
VIGIAACIAPAGVHEVIDDGVEFRSEASE